jgi:ATP-dependent Clp protease ATP-binding subunit ClpA
MSRASVEARRRCAPDIAPMHLLLALLDSSEAAEILGLSADDLATVRADVLAELEA